MHQEIDSELDALARQVVDAAFKVHRSLGPGLLESAYEICLGVELSHRGLICETQVPVNITYGGVTVDSAFRLDLLVDGRLIVEIKAVEKLLPVHEAQLLTYLRLSSRRLGLLINFNVPLIKQGIKRLAL
jgi:GxxExxY protein